MHEVLVVNASPHVPQQVYDEVAGSMHTDSAAHRLADAGWIERASTGAIPTSIVEWDIGAGESAVIALAMGIPGATAVIDDLFGRKCALAHRIGVIGCVGLVIAAHRRGDIADPKSVLLELRSAGMRLSDSVIDRALALASSSE